MGCDIHMRVEYYNEGNEMWRNCDHYILDYNCSPDQGNSSCYSIVPIWADRYYNFFALLANVRNSYNLPFVAEPKDIPEDVSAIVERDIQLWGEDGHSHSWATLRELIEFRRCTMLGCQSIPEQAKVAFATLINRLEDRLAETFRIEAIDGELETKRDHLRIVFWFDN